MFSAGSEGCRQARKTPHKAVSSLDTGLSLTSRASGGHRAPQHESHLEGVTRPGEGVTVLEVCLLATKGNVQEKGATVSHWQPRSLQPQRGHAESGRASSVHCTSSQLLREFGGILSLTAFLT